MLKKALQDIGLNAGEAKVYLACLKLGTQDIKTIAEETHLSKYDTKIFLEHLLRKGFLSIFSRQKDFYTPEHPEMVLKILENDKRKMEEKLKKFQNLLPFFDEYIDPLFSKPEIAFYEGKEGIIAAYEDTLTTKNGILAITSIDDTESNLKDYVLDYYKKRTTAGIHIKAIFPDTKMSRERQKKDKEELRESRLLHKDVLKLQVEMNIYDDKIAYFSIHEELAIIVQSKLISESMRQIFDICWKMAEIHENGKNRIS